MKKLISWPTAIKRLIKLVKSSLKESSIILLYYKSRSALMIFSISLAIFLFFIVNIIGEVGEGVVKKELDRFGINTFWIYLPQKEHKRVSKSDFSTSVHYINNSDLQYLKKYFPDNIYIPQLFSKSKVEANNVELFYGIVGTNENAKYGFELKEGRFLSNADIRNQEKVCVISYQAAKNLFNRETPINKKINLFGDHYTIIGVLSPKEKGLLESFGVDQNDVSDRIFIPLSHIQKIMNTRNIKVLKVISTKEQPNIAARKILNYLESSHRKKVRFESELVQKYADIAEKILKSLRLTMLFISSICLAIGCLGIFNMMQIGVNERKKEIGIRKAIGATDNSIKMQFLTESILICFFGGLIGSILSFLSVLFINAYVTIHNIVFLPLLFKSLLISVLVGVISGLYPAIKASNLNIMETLRYE